MVRTYFSAAMLMILILSGCSAATAPVANTTTAVAPDATALPTPPVEAPPVATLPATNPSAEAQPAVTPPPGTNPFDEGAPGGLPNPPEAGSDEPAGAAITLIIQSIDDGSLSAVNLSDGREILLADPTVPGNRLPWALEPGGQRVAVVVFERSSEVKAPELLNAALWIVNRDGSDPRALLDLLTADGSAPPDQLAARLVDTINASQQPNNLLHWMGNGEILIVSEHSGQPDLYAVDAEQGTIRQLTNTPDLEFDLQLNADETMLAYTSVSSFGTGGGPSDAQLWVQPLDGAAIPIELPPAASNIPYSVISVEGWQGERLYASAATMGGMGGTLFAIEQGAVVASAAIPVPLVSATNGAGLLTITSYRASPDNTLWFWDAAGEAQALGSFNLTTLATAPDGQHALGCTDAPTADYPLVLIDLSAPQAMELGPSQCNDVRWSADSRFVAVAGNNEAQVFDTATGELTQLLGFNHLAGWNGSQLLVYTAADAGWQLYGQDMLTGERTHYGAALIQEPSNIVEIQP